MKAWGSVHGVHVRIDAFDGARARGSFAGTFEFGNQSGGVSLPPLAVESGTFDVVVRRF